MRDRSSFGYMEPSPDTPEFAQCGECFEWLKRSDRCLLLQKSDEVLESDSCIMFVQGSSRERGEPTGLLTKEEVGFHRGAVRCENCVSVVDGEDCELYRRLDEDHPGIFALGTRIKPRACCNAWDDDK